MNIEFRKMHKQFIKLLNIHGTSGNEDNVRYYIRTILESKGRKLLDNVFVDTYGNLLGEKTYGDGNGATILFSAHMDTVKGVQADRKVIENNGIITSNRGALGADDRAGIAIILEVLRRVDNLSFNGTIKVAFTKEEEVGCIGANRIDKDWLDGIDLAIIVDRRGNRDIVVGTWGTPFCSTPVGKFFEEVSEMQDMDWKAVEGGISDTMIFADFGINGVNLSAGYENEHTEKEYCVFADMIDTLRLILQALVLVNDFVDTFEPVPVENEWVKGYTTSTYYKSGNKYYDYATYANSYFEDEMIYADCYDEENGDVFIYEMGRDIVIQQGDKEIFLSRESLKSLIKQLKKAV